MNLLVLLQSAMCIALGFFAALCFGLRIAAQREVERLSAELAEVKAINVRILASMVPDKTAAALGNEDAAERVLDANRAVQFVDELTGTGV